MVSSCTAVEKKESKTIKKPNILFAISDDQSWLHTSSSGCKFVTTPAFDQIAKKGVQFTNAYAAAPQCSPNRAAILTGKNIWQLEEAGTHGSYFPKKFTVFTNLLDSAGYFVGYTGKGWGPGNFKDAGWSQNPVGKVYNDQKLAQRPSEGVSSIDYASNFTEFMKAKRKDQPFFFWYGCYEPHRKYEEGSGLRSGKKLDQVKVPGFLPDVEAVRSDFLDYGFEIDWFDRQLGKMLSYLDSIGELKNTIIVVTSDNGMPFPRAKANLYEYGVHLPLAVYFPGMKSLGEVSGLISFTDLAPTFLEAAGVNIPSDMVGKSIIPLLKGDKDSLHQAVFFGRERHSHSRPDNLGYPSRGVRESDFIYIRNFKPDRWPAGVGPDERFPEGYYDIDNSPSKTVIEMAGYERYLSWSVAKRPAEELYNVVKDPDCLNNLSDVLSDRKEKLAEILMARLKSENDPRVKGNGDIFDSYPRFGAMRDYPGFKKKGEYNPDYQNQKTNQQ